MLVDEHVEPSVRVTDYILQLLVHVGASVLHFFQNGLQNDHIGDDIFLQNVDLRSETFCIGQRDSFVRQFNTDDTHLIQDNISVQQQIIGARHYRIFYARIPVVQINSSTPVQTLAAGFRAAMDIVSEIVLSDDLKKKANEFERF